VLKVDLHLHTAEDPVDRIPHTAVQLIDRAATLGFDALAITLHDSQFIDPGVTAYARERGITLIPGIERTIQGRHVLLLNFPSASVESVRTMNDLRALKIRCGGLVIAPHPYYPGTTCLRGLLGEHAEVFDAVEWSYFWTHGVNFNRFAVRWAKEHGKPVVGNSDLHDLQQLGRTYSLVDAPADPAAICAAIRAGRVTLQTEPVPPTELALVLARMVVRSIQSVLTPEPVRT
jgi:predicted metal-dependent phosphoesterase TrpH